MRRAILLAAATVLVAACAIPGRNPDHAIVPSGLGESQPQQGFQVTPDTPRWAAYREFNFDSTSMDVSISDASKLREIVAYVESDSSLDVGIDGTLGTEGVSQADRNLSDRRTASVRRALMDTGAGVASYKILMGPFAESKNRRSGQIQVLIGPRIGSPTAAPWP